MKSPVERVETKTGHFYRNTETGKAIPGVTTILKALPKEALDTWRLRQAVGLTLKGDTAWGDYDPEGGKLVDWLIGAGDRVANTAADIGTNAHQFAEDYMTGNEPDLESLAKKERKHVDCFLEFVRDYQPDPVLVEKVLVHIDPKSGQPLYMGTMDLIAKLTWNDESNPNRLPNNWEDGLTWLVDYKASSKQARPSHALQQAAYRYATHWLDEDGTLQPMVPVDKTAVILLNGGGAGHCYRGYELDSGPVVFSVFRSLLRITNFAKIEDRVILGEL